MKKHDEFGSHKFRYAFIAIIADASYQDISGTGSL